MAIWSYDPTLTTSVDRVRLLIGDTDGDDPQLQNEEIAYFISTSGTLMAAAAAACRSLASKYARFADKWVGDLKILASQKSKAYERLAETYGKKGAIYAVPSAGGVYVAEKDANAGDASLVPSAFRIGMHDAAGD